MIAFPTLLDDIDPGGQDIGRLVLVDGIATVCSVVEGAVVVVWLFFSRCRSRSKDNDYCSMNEREKPHFAELRMKG